LELERAGISCSVDEVRILTRHVREIKDIPLDQLNGRILSEMSRLPEKGSGIPGEDADSGTQS
jgi:hypothetical protein